MMKQKIASVLIAVMLVTQSGMGFSFAASEPTNDRAENQNTSITDNVEINELDNVKNVKLEEPKLDIEDTGTVEIDKSDIAETGKNEEVDNAINEQSENVKTDNSGTGKTEKTDVADKGKTEKADNEDTGTIEIEKTDNENIQETKKIDITENGNIQSETLVETDNAVPAENIQTLEPTEEIQLLSEELPQEKSSMEEQLEKVTAYYKSLGQDAKISAPMEGVARFAVGERPSLKALKAASQMESQYHLKYNEISDLKFGDANSSDVLSETTDGLNAQVWLSQIVLDILSAGGDPTDFEGHNYIHELLSTQSLSTGFFTNDQKPKAADGLALLALSSYWGDSWPDNGSHKDRTTCITNIEKKVNIIKGMNFSGSEIPNFMKRAQWGITDFSGITFYNNFWLTQGLSLDVLQKTNVGTLATGIAEIKGSNPKNPFYSSQCETLAACIIAKLSAGQEISESDWEKLAEFQMEDGQYKRTTRGSSANGEATAMATIALDYGENAKSAFLRLANANTGADRIAVKEAEEKVFSDAAKLKTEVDSAQTINEIVDKIKEMDENVSFVSSNDDIVSPEDKEVHTLEAGETDTTVQLKIIIKNGNCATVIRTKVFNIEPEDKTFPFERNFDLLKQYYKNYPQDEENKGINRCHQAFSVASLMNDKQLDGIPYNTQFYGEGGYFSNYVTFQSPIVSAALDCIAMNKDPKQYMKISPGTGFAEQVDLIDKIMEHQYDNGSFFDPSLASRSPYKAKSCTLYTMALESFFGGKGWGNEKAGTKYGRIGAIEDIFAHMIDAENDISAEDRKDIDVEGGRILNNIGRDGGIRINGQLTQSLAVILFSRWLNDDTEITVKGEKKAVKEFAQKEIDGILKTLKWVYDEENESKFCKGRTYETEEYAYYISALVTSGHKDKVDEYGLWNRLRNGRTENGSYYHYPVIPEDKATTSWEPATIAVAMAMGDYQNDKSILASMTYDTSAIDDTEAVQKDIINIILPSIAKENISLPVKGYYGSTISWTSSNPDVIDASTGNIVRPKRGQMNAFVSLTATIQRGERAETKTFLIKVPAVISEENKKGTEDYDALSVPLFITGDIELPTVGKNGSSIDWESSNSDAIANSGKVTLGDTDTKVTLKATITNETFTKLKEFQVTVSKQLTDDVVEKAVAQLRAYYNDHRNLSDSYWDIFAAKSVLGDAFEDYNFKVYDVKSHRVASSWQGTDYGGVVLQILAQGDNPYNYQGENYVEKLQKYVEKEHWGPWCCPIWAAMALDAAGAEPSGYKYNRISAIGMCMGMLDNLDYGPDMAGWALVPIATTKMRSGEVNTEKINSFVETMKKSQKNSGENKGLFDTYKYPGMVMTLSSGCVVSGFMAMQKAGLPGLDLTKEDWKVDDTGVLEGIYNQEILGKSNVSPQFIVEFGDVYYGDSVWRRVGVKPEQFTELIEKAAPLVSTGNNKYTVKSFRTLKNAYETALEVKNDADKMQNYYFGQSYFNLKDAVEGLKEKGTAEITIYGRTGNSKILDKTSIHKSGSLLEILQEVALENAISITSTDKKIEELGGIKADNKGQWYVYKQTDDENGTRIIEPLNQYNVEEGTSLIFKYCEDTSKLQENLTLNQHLVYDAAKDLKLSGAIDSNSNVTGNLVLTNEGLFGTTITWLPNKLFAINENGKVTRDAKEDINVVLTAKINLNGISTTKQFKVKVKSLNGGSSVTPTVKKAYISIVGPVGEKWSGKYSKAAIEIEAGETAFSLLEKTGVSVNVDKNTKYGVYIRGINGLSEFDRGNQSGWMYRVDGDFPGHSAALERIYENNYVEWLYTKNLGRDVGGYISGVEHSNRSIVEKTQKSFNTVTVDTKVTASINSATGEAKAVVNAAKMTKALKEMQEKVKAAKQDGKSDVVTELRIDVAANSKANSVETDIPKSSVISLRSGVDKMSIITGVGNVTFDSDTIKKFVKGTKGDLKITIAKTDAGTVISKISGVTNEVKSKAKGRPAYEFTAESGDNTISELGGTAISIVPYTLGNGEKPEAVVAYWMNPEGSLELVQNGHLSDDNKYFVMENNHWSTYVIGYNEVKFADTASHWAKKNILYLAARDVIKGKSANAFLPNSQITRAEFAQILANMSGDDISKYTGSKFNDVSEKAWYANAVAWAVENGIAGGIGNGKFSPDANITRQDMSVMISKYVKNVEKETLTDVNKPVKFADNSEIASYAKDAVTIMQKAGIINGVKNNFGTYSFKPKANATRAEAATMIANYIQ